MAPPGASAWVVRFAPRVAAGAREPDLACGYGRHARLFAARGNHVLTVDRDPGALAALAMAPALPSWRPATESDGPAGFE